MAEQATRIKDQDAGDYIATRDANELDNDGNARTIQIIGLSARQLISPDTLRGSTPVTVADGVDLDSLPADLIGNLLEVGDKTTLIVNPEHVASDGAVNVTPIIFDADDVALAIGEKKASTMSDLFTGICSCGGVWVEKATQFGVAQRINTLAVFNDNLYSGTNLGGHLLKWNGTNAWVEKAPQLGSELIQSLVVFNGKLYGGTASLGKLFEWNGVDAWAEKADQLNSQTHIYSLAVFNGKLYGGTSPGGRLFEWNGTNAWVQVASQLNSEQQIKALAVFNGKLYGGTAYNGRLFEWNGTDAWIEVAPQLGTQVIYSLAVFNEKLYGSGVNGVLSEWNGTNAWVEVAPQLNSQNYIHALMVCREKLYGGTSDLGKLFEWNGSNAWVEKADQLNSQAYIYSLAVFNGKLYGGTSTGGRLFEATPGSNYRSPQLQWDVSGATKVGLHITSITGTSNEVTLKGGLI